MRILLRAIFILLLPFQISAMTLNDLIVLHVFLF